MRAYLGFEELWNVEREGDDDDGGDVHEDAPGARHGQRQVPVGARI
jgi:hypothetical protein